MTNKTQIYRNKTALIVSLCLIGGFGQAANYDISSQDLLAPSKEEDQFQFDLPFDEREGVGFESLIDQEQESQQASYQSVLELIKQNKLDQAEARVDQLIKQHPEQAEFYNLQALIKIQQKNNAAAAASFQQTLRINPKNLTALQGQAFLAIENNDFKSAHDFLEKAISTNRKAVLAYILNANIAYRQKDLVEVENVLSTALENVKGDSDLALQVGSNLIKLYEIKQEPKKILELAQTLEKSFPEDNRMLSILAKAQVVNQQPDAAHKTLQKIIEQDKQDVFHRLFLARLYMIQPNGAEEASKLIDEALHVAPNNLKVLIFKTIFLTKAKQYEQAMALAEKVDINFPESTAGKMLKADIYLAQQQLDQALSYNQQAYQLQPNARLFQQIVTLLSSQGKADDAIQLLNNELDKNPQDLASHFQIANFYLNQQSYTKAESHYQAILKNNPDNTIVLNNLAMVYYHQNKPKALEFAKKAYDGAPDSAIIADTYGIVLLQQGRPQDALAVLIKAGEMAPNNPEIQFHLAKAYQANGNQQAAIELLEKIVNQPAEFVKKQAAIDWLKRLKSR